MSSFRFRSWVSFSTFTSTLTCQSTTSFHWAVNASVFRYICQKKHESTHAKFYFQSLFHTFRKPFGTLSYIIDGNYIITNSSWKLNCIFPYTFSLVKDIVTKLAQRMFCVTPYTYAQRFRRFLNDRCCEAMQTPHTDNIILGKVNQLQKIPLMFFKTFFQPYYHVWVFAKFDNFWCSQETATIPTEPLRNSNLCVHIKIVS